MHFPRKGIMALIQVKELEKAEKKKNFSRKHSKIYQG